MTTDTILAPEMVVYTIEDGLEAAGPYTPIVAPVEYLRSDTARDAAIREAALHVENAKRLRRYDWQEWTAQDIEDAEGIICAFLALIQKGTDHE